MVVMSESSGVCHPPTQGGAVLPEALRGDLLLEGVLKGLCGILFEGSAASAGVRGLFRGFASSDSMLVTLRNC